MTTGHKSNSEDFSINDLRITYIAIQHHCPCVAPILKKNGNNSKEKRKGFADNLNSKAY
jgi:hypothetical protein